MGKRLVKSPKFFCPSGILHALLNIADTEALMGHPVAGQAGKVLRSRI
jgi:hypothetical protein